MAVYPSIYKALTVSIDGTAVKAFVPQVFGDVPITITNFVGAIPGATGPGWVFFQAGNPEFPVWVVGGGSVIDHNHDATYVNTTGDTMTGPLVVPAPTLGGHAANRDYVLANLGGDEIQVSAAEPTAPSIEVWYDTDAADGLSTTEVLHWNTSWGVIARGTQTLANGSAVAAGATATLGTVTFNKVTGRRYKVKLFLNAINCGVGAHVYFPLAIDGGANSGGAAWVSGVGAYQMANVEYMLDDFAGWTALTGTHMLTLKITTVEAATVHNDLGFILVEDCGPLSGAAALPLDGNIKEHLFYFPPSLALTAGNFHGLALTGISTPDYLMEAVDLARPAGWTGPNPLRTLAFKETGLYEIKGQLSLSSSVDANAGSTYMTCYTRAGVANPPGVRGFTTPYGPFYHNGVGLFSATLWVTSTDVTLMFGAYYASGSISTWSTPGTLSIIKVR